MVADTVVGDTVVSNPVVADSTRDSTMVADTTRDITAVDKLDITEFKALVRCEGARLYRDLPWRDTRDPYLVLCSEVMLQQTQVKRVLNYWEKWATAFPTIDALAAASVADVLEAWQGLGYNRRALALKRAADICSARYDGEIPEGYPELLVLPGVGPTTAAGVCIFAFGQVQVYLETNVRAVFIHHFFKDCDKVQDSEIVPLLRACCDVDDPRSWYYALLDYGNHLKSIMPNPSRRSASYARQSAFEGSLRQKRAFLLRELLEGSKRSADELLQALSLVEIQAGRAAMARNDMEDILSALAAEGFIAAVDEDCWTIAE